MTTSTKPGGALQDLPFGLWREPLNNYPGGSFVGRAAAAYDALAQVGLRLHNQNRAVILARAANKEPVIPEPGVRTALARSEQKKLAAMAEHLDAIEGELTAWKAKTLRPFDYPANVSATSDTFAARTELRAVLRAMTPKDRAAALRDDVEFRKAALELRPQVSGLVPTEYALLCKSSSSKSFRASCAPRPTASRRSQPRARTCAPSRRQLRTSCLRSARRSSNRTRRSRATLGPHDQNRREPVSTKNTKSAGRGKTSSPMNVAPARNQDVARSANASAALKSAHARHRSSDQRGKSTFGGKST
jgi:hypothetical protein